MRKYKKHKPPSRIRYEKSHPTVCFRLNKELKERLKKALEGRSFASFVKEALGVIKRERKSLEEAREEGYHEGYEKAQMNYGLWKPCSGCGRKLIIGVADCKRELEELKRNLRWYCVDCAERME